MSGDEHRGLAGLANVAALAFLAGRAVPGGFWLALAGGVPLARAAQRHGGRAGYATASASLVETVAVMGPARISVPLPHAASAPALGVLAASGAGLAAMALTSAAIRLAYYLFFFAFYIGVLVGVDAFTGTYERLRAVAGFLPAGEAAALWLTAAFLLAWSLCAGLIQAALVRRGLRRWAEEPSPERAEATAADRGSADARAVAFASVVAFVLVLATTDATVLAVVGAWLATVWAASGAGGRPLLAGLALAAPLALSTLAFGVVGGLGWELAGRRSARVALLVLVAVWLRAAAGADGLRVLSLALVRRLRWLRTLSLAALVLGASAGAGHYATAARRLAARLAGARRRPVALLDAALAWVADESSRAPAATPGEEGAPPRRGPRAPVLASAGAALPALVAVALLVAPGG